MGIRKGEWLLILFNLAYIIGFAIYYVSMQNYEFLLYIAVLVVLFAVVVFTLRTTKFDYLILWLLSIWGLLHMMGGGVHIGSEVLYRYHVISLYQGIETEFFILKFDQVLHFYVYVIMTLILVHLMKPIIEKSRRKGYLYLLAALASIGVGALNEIVEFAAVVFLGQTGVGGYYNTALDLVFNTLGAFVGLAVVKLRKQFA